MDEHGSNYVDLTDGVSHWLENLASAAWVIYTPWQNLYHIGGVSLGAPTNNQVEYKIFIGLLSNTFHLGIMHLHIQLDSNLVVS